MTGACIFAMPQSCSRLGHAFFAMRQYTVQRHHYMVQRPQDMAQRPKDMVHRQQYNAPGENLMKPLETNLLKPFETSRNLCSNAPVVELLSNSDRN